MAAAAAREEEDNPAKVRFQDANHAWWTVHEIRDPHSPTGASLIFVSADGFRRVRDYPPGWRDLPAAELTALSWKR